MPLSATAGIWGTTQVHWEAPRLTLSVSGLHPSSNLCICCQLQFCTRHRAPHSFTPHSNSMRLVLTTVPFLREETEAQRG